MLQKLSVLLKESRSSFSLERVICRLLAAWCSFTAYCLIKDGSFDKIEYGQNVSFGYIFLFVALCFLIYSIVNIIIYAYESDTWFLIVGATICVIRWLWIYESNPNKFLFLMAVIVAYSFFVIHFVQKNMLLWEMWKPGKRTVWAIGIICGIFCGFIIAAATCYRYLTFSSPNFDFGLFVNMFHNMKRTGLPLCTCERDVLLSHFVVHLSPIYYVLLPFYIIFPSPLTLQIGQAVILASGVIPVILLCKQFKLSGKYTILMAIIYTLYPALSTGCFYDIHENCFLTPLLLWMFYFYERGKYGCMYLFAFLTLMVKEDAAIYIILFALYVLLSKKKLYQGGVLLLGSLVYFGIALSSLETSSTYYAELYADNTPNPTISGPMINRFNNLIFNPAEGLAGVIRTAIVNPGYLITQLFSTSENGWEKLVYFFQMFLPLGLIPFCTNKPSRWLLIVPVLMNLLTNYQYQYDIGYQYHFGIIAFLIYVAIMNLPDLKGNNRRNMVSVAVAASLCLYIIYVLPVFLKYHENWKEEKDKYIQMETILDSIPQEASVCCSTFLVAHMAERDEVYDLDYHNNIGDVDYVVFDARYDIDNGQMNAFLNQGYEIKAEYEGMIIILEKDGT